MSICQGCGGAVGRDCFNPQECEWIARDMQARQAAEEYTAPLVARIAELEAKISALPEGGRNDAALRACDGLSTLDLAGNKRGWLAELCRDAHKLDEPYRAGAEKCLQIVKEMRAASLDSDGVDYGILSRVEYRLQKVVDSPVAPLPSIPSPPRQRDPDALKKRKQPCTCTGSCRGPEGLGEGWVCGLTLPP